MNDKCEKLKDLFVLLDDDALKKHIEVCSDCKEEYEKLNKVSDLISEVRSHYKSKSRKRRKLIAVCAAFCLVIFSSTFCYICNDEDISNSLMYGDSLTAEDLGFPVDSDGLLMVD